MRFEKQLAVPRGIVTHNDFSDLARDTLFKCSNGFKGLRYIAANLLRLPSLQQWGGIMSVPRCDLCHLFCKTEGMEVVPIYDSGFNPGLNRVEVHCAKCAEHLPTQTAREGEKDE